MNAIFNKTILLSLFIAVLSCEKNDDFDASFEEASPARWELIATYIEGQETQYMVEIEDGIHYNFSNNGTFTSNHTEGTKSGVFYMEANNLILSFADTTDLEYRNSETQPLTLAKNTVISVEGQRYIHKKAISF
ncbi:hypothetical protein VQ01_02465 [Tamlana sp. s12]|nr:hypothetical protein VQ01_02465 [Tamlana sp. s12]